MSGGEEFDRQAQRLVRLGYPALAGMSERRFMDLLSPLRAPADRQVRAAAGTVPFLVVISTELVPAWQTVPLTTLADRAKLGTVSFDPDDLGRFRPADPVAALLPDQPAYLVTGVERGEQYCGVTPDKATPAIAERGRSPLTIAEGVALITHYPELLVKNKCFSLAGSRCGDRRVPALWISQGAPKLGWCWAGNPHTWLGTASCAGRWPEAPCGDDHASNS